jgi:hypothetical protein
MFEKIKRQLTKIIEGLESSVRRFPETVAVALALVIVGIVMNHLDYDDELMDRLAKFIIVLIMGVPLMAGVKLLVERMNLSVVKRIGIDVVVVAFLFVYRGIVPDEIGSEFMIKYFLILTSSLLFFSLVPYVLKRNNYSRYILKLITAFFITILFSIVLYGGLNAIIFTIEQLFEVNIDNTIHFDLFIIIAGLFSVTHFLSRIPSVDEELETYYPPVLKGLFIYIIIPLISIYTVILYAYFIRLILLREFPINMLGHLVVWYGLISVIILFFVNQIKDENLLVGRFYKWMPIAIAIPLGMLFAAIGSRIADFGMTPSRYFVVISGIWIALSMAYIYFTKNLRSSLLVIMAIAVLLISGYGPQSAFNLSLANQTVRFENLLVDYGMLEAGIITPKSNLEDEKKQEINEFIRYFENNHEFVKVHVLPEDFDFDQMEDVFGFEYSYYFPREYKNVNYFMPDFPIAIDIAQYDYYLDMRVEVGMPSEVVDGTIRFEYIDEDQLLFLYREDMVVAEVNIKEIMQEYHAMRDGIQPSNAEESIIEVTFEGADLTFFIENMYYELENEEMSYGSFDFKLFIKWQ